MNNSTTISVPYFSTSVVPPIEQQLQKVTIHEDGTTEAHYLLLPVWDADFEGVL
jgi:hypothetical protein